MFCTEQPQGAGAPQPPDPEGASPMMLEGPVKPWIGCAVHLRSFSGHAGPRTFVMSNQWSRQIGMEYLAVAGACRYLDRNHMVLHQGLHTDMPTPSTRVLVLHRRWAGLDVRRTPQPTQGDARYHAHTFKMSRRAKIQARGTSCLNPIVGAAQYGSRPDWCSGHGQQT